MERTAHLELKTLGTVFAAALGVLVVSFVPVISDVAEYTRWFREGPPEGEGVEPLFSLLATLFRHLGGYPVFIKLYVAALCGSMAYALLTKIPEWLSPTNVVAVAGAGLYLLSPYFLFNQALLVRQSMAALIIVCFVFFEWRWFWVMLAAPGLHAYGMLMLVFNRRVLLVAGAVVLVAVLILDPGLQFESLGRQLNFINQVTSEEGDLGGLAFVRYLLSTALVAFLVASSNKRIRTLGIVLTVLAVAAPLALRSAIFLTRACFLVFYWAPLLSALTLLREPKRFGVLRHAAAASIFVIGLYSSSVSFINLGNVLTDAN
jgi:hypothetical protein